MTIPKDLKHEEVGVLLQAVGQEMYFRNLSFGAALEDGHSHAAIVENMVGELDSLDCPDSRKRAHELLQLTGEEIINFNELEA